MEDDLWGGGKEKTVPLSGLMVYFKSERESLATVGRLRADELWPPGLLWGRGQGEGPGGGRRGPYVGRGYLSTL